MTVGAGHLRRCNRTLAVPRRRLDLAQWHPLKGVEVPHFPHNPALRRQLRAVEERGPADARAPGEGGLPEFLDTDANGGDDSETGDDGLVLHRLANPR